MVMLAFASLTLRDPRANEEEKNLEKELVYTGGLLELYQQEEKYIWKKTKLL